MFLNLNYIGSKDQKIDILESKMQTIKVLCDLLLSLKEIEPRHIKTILEIINQ